MTCFSGLHPPMVVNVEVSEFFYGWNNGACLLEESSLDIDSDDK